MWSSSRKKRPFQTETVSYTASPRVNPRSKSGIRASWAGEYSPSMNATPSAMMPPSVDAPAPVVPRERFGGLGWADPSTTTLRAPPGGVKTCRESAARLDGRIRTPGPGARRARLACLRA